MNNTCIGGVCHTTPRLEAIIDIIGDAHTVADIGCDHAYLPILLAQRGRTKKIIGADVKEGPLAKARANVERFGFADAIELRLGSGLTVLCEGEADCVVIAGMGANVIAKILTDSEKIAKSTPRIILQSMTGSEDLRKFLYENGYKIENEALVREDRRIYAIMTVSGGKKTVFTPFDCYISPALRSNGSPLFDEYFEKQRERIARACEGMKMAKTTAAQIDYYEALINEFNSYGRKMTNDKMQ